MKILLINPPSSARLLVRDMAGGLGFDGGSSVVLPPLELSYMAATLLQNGHEVRLVDSDVANYTSQDVYQVVEQYVPDAVIATLSLPTLFDDCLFLKGLRAHSSARILVKTNVSYPPILEEVVQKSSADICLYGECDLTINRILRGEERRGTARLENGGLVVEENCIVEDLDDLPLPARQLIPNDKYRYILLGDAVTTMQTSRGCSFPCAYYCPYPLVQGRKWRSRSPAHVLTEIKDIVRNYGIKKILFRDATFTLDKARTNKICEVIIKEGVEIEWWCETRIDCLDEELMAMMKRAGCRGMNIGVETGDPAIMATQAKIGLTLEKLVAVRQTAKKLGLRLHFLLMIGLPKETKRSLYKTYMLIQRLNPESIGVCIVTPYPGTPLYAEAKEKGWLETEDWSKFGGHYPVAHTDKLSAKDMMIAHRYILRIFSLRHEGSLRARLKAAAMEAGFKLWALLSA